MSNWWVNFLGKCIPAFGISGFLLMFVLLAFGASPAIAVIMMAISLAAAGILLGAMFLEGVAKALRRKRESTRKPDWTERARFSAQLGAMMAGLGVVFATLDHGLAFALDPVRLVADLIAGVGFFAVAMLYFLLLGS